jgi:hypothetical protein
MLIGQNDLGWCAETAHIRQSDGGGIALKLREVLGCVNAVHALFDEHAPAKRPELISAPLEGCGVSAGSLIDPQLPAEPQRVIEEIEQPQGQHLSELRPMKLVVHTSFQ